MLVDDHRLFRHALRTLLEQAPDIVVVAEAGNGVELLARIRDAEMEVACVDMDMSRMHGIEAIRQLREARPSVGVIGLSAFSDRAHVENMLKAGAAGYVSKSASGEELLRAIRCVRLGRTYLCSALAHSMPGMTTAAAHGEPQVDVGMNMNAPRLGSRERQVIQLVAEGYTTAQIAERLNLAFSTVGVHRRNIMRKLNIHKAAELTCYAIRTGIASPDRSFR